MRRFVHLDPDAGFCTGVQKAIDKAEQHLAHNEVLFCLGQLVHNEPEELRLQNMGMQVIGLHELDQVGGNTVMIRAHGEPPSTYQMLKDRNMHVIDATCPTVLRLQSRIRKLNDWATREAGQIAVFGKHGHPEVLGLCGQTETDVIILELPEDIQQINPNKPLQLFCQTTQDAEAYVIMADNIRQYYLNMQSQYIDDIVVHPSICRQVAVKKSKLQDFAKEMDVVVFVAGKQSSNGRYLFSACQEVNMHSFWISSSEQIQQKWFSHACHIGVSGAASTPAWLLNEVKKTIEKMIVPEA